MYVNVTIPASLSAALDRKCQVADDDSTTTWTQLDCSRLTRGCNTRDTCTTNWNANLKDGVNARTMIGHPYSFLLLNKNNVCIFINVHLLLARAKERKEGGKRKKERKSEKYRIDCYYDDCYTGKAAWVCVVVTGSLENLYEANKFLFVVLFLSQYLVHYICSQLIFQAKLLNKFRN